MSKKNDNTKAVFIQNEWTKRFVRIVQKLTKQGIFKQSSFARKINIDPTALNRILKEKSRDMPEKYWSVCERILAKDYKVNMTKAATKNKQGTVYRIVQDGRVFRSKDLEAHTKPELIALCKKYEQELSGVDEKMAGKDMDYDKLNNAYQMLHEELGKARKELDEYRKAKK